MKKLYHLLNQPIPLYVQKNILFALGGLTLTSIILQVISGIMMTFYYTPSIENAYNSVDYITYSVPLGWLIRGLHVYNASALFILVFLHLVRTFFSSAYKKPREITWLTGVLLLLLIIGFAFTGALLPWDQHGYWATVVGTKIVAGLPFIGQWLAQVMHGGSHLGQLSLTRFYAMHVIILPIILLTLLNWHFRQLRHGFSPPLKKHKKSLERSVPFFPYRLFTHTFLATLLLSALIFVSWKERAPLEFPADPTSTSYEPRPMWYFLAPYQLFEYFPGRLEPIASILIPLLVIGSMLLLPFIDKNKEHRFWRKPLVSFIGFLYISGIVFLTLWAFFTF